MSIQLEQIQKTLEKHVKESEETARKVHDMHFILMGNAPAKVDGIAQMVYKHERYIQNDKRIKWMGAGAVSILNLGFFAWLKTKLGL